MTVDTHTDSRTTPQRGRSVAVWDLPTRLFHWGLVLTVLSTWPSFTYAERLGDPTLRWHRYNGYAILILITFRIIWGFVGSSTARWTSFVRWPWDAARYGIDLLRGANRKFLGHNPLGTYMVLALLVVVTGQAIIGLVVTEHNDTTWGPLYNLVSEDLGKRLRHWHVAGLYWMILPLAALHIVANSLYGLMKRDPLIRAMVTGHKPADDYEDADEAGLVRRPFSRAGVVLLLSAAIVFGAIMLLGGKPFY